MRRSELIQGVVSWNNRFPLDRWWRIKHNVSFMSPAHRESSFLYQLMEFEEDYLSGKINKDFDSIRIKVVGLDKRRFNIYKRSLIPLGYTLNTSSGYSYLYKDIKRK